MTEQFSLTPGFSPVVVRRQSKTVSTVLREAGKPLKRLAVADGHQHPAEAGC
jgi:hypothetical protein